MKLKRIDKLALRRHTSGITLIELMVVVTVIAALGVIAVPSYRQYAMRAQRSEAKAALLQIATNQERFYLQNNTYTNNLAALGFPAGTTDKGVYTLNILVANANTFQAIATPTPGGGINGVDQTADVDCAQFAINAQGLRTALPDPNAQCW